jgi:hypothetical protein
MADDSDVIEAKAVVLVIPEQPGQPLRTELLAVELNQIREHNDSGRCGISIQADQPQKHVVLEKQGTVATTAEAAVEQHTLAALIQQALELGEPSQHGLHQHGNVIKGG